MRLFYRFRKVVRSGRFFFVLSCGSHLLLLPIEMHFRLNEYPKLDLRCITSKDSPRFMRASAENNLCLHATEERESQRKSTRLQEAYSKDDTRLSRANTRCRSLRLQFKRVIRCYCMGRNYLIEAFILALRFPSHMVVGVCAAMTSLRLPPNTSHSMEVRSTMTTITMLEGEVTVISHRCSPTVTTYMEPIRSGSLM